MAKRDRPVSRCEIHLEEYRGGSKCYRCGWWPAEIERRKALPLIKGKDGLYRKALREVCDDGDTAEQPEAVQAESD